MIGSILRRNLGLRLMVLLLRPLRLEVLRGRSVGEEFLLRRLSNRAYRTTLMKLTGRRIHTTLRLNCSAVMLQAALYLPGEWLGGSCLNGSEIGPRERR